MMINSLKLCKFLPDELQAQNLRTYEVVTPRRRWNLPQQAPTYSKNPRHFTHDSSALLADNGDPSTVNKKPYSDTTTIQPQ
jgi:hypothetical protein